MKQILTPLLVSSLVFFSCKDSREGIAERRNYAIDIQPLGDIPSEDYIFVYNELRKFFPLVTLKSNVIFLPKAAYNSNRDRYRADSLIRWISKMTDTGHITLGLTSVDISTTKDGHEDWGVMGLGFLPGNACIASSFRLSKSKKREQFFKISIHELGHTLGLPHCPVVFCFMRDAEGSNLTDELMDFCDSCKIRLKTQ